MTRADEADRTDPPADGDLVVGPLRLGPVTNFGGAAEALASINISHGCVGNASPEGKFVLILWPHGTTWDPTTNTITAPGQQIAHIGQHSTVGGQLVDRSDLQRYFGADGPRVVDAISTCGSDFDEVFVASSQETAIANG